MPYPRLVLLALATLTMGANLWGIDIYILDEAKNATCAYEMSVRGDWIVPTFNGNLRTDKPPLHYYFMQLGYGLWGVSPLGARFFSALCGLAMVWLTYTYARRAWGEQAAFWAGMVLVASVQISAQFHLATPDPYLIFLLTAALLLWWEGVERSSLGRLYGSYVLFGLGVLAKGPVAVVVPGLALLLFLGLSGRLSSWRCFFSVHPLRGLLVALLVALPWYAAVWQATDGAWIEGFFLDHNLSRFEAAKEGHGGFFGLTALLYVAGLLPFGVFLPQAVARVWAVRREESLLLLSLCVMVAFVGFFSVSGTKLPSYPAPAFAFGALVLGYWLREGRLSRVSLWVWAVLSSVLVVGAAVGIHYDRSLSGQEYLAAYLLGLPLGAWWALWDPRRALWALALGGVLGSMGFFYGAFPRADQENPVRVARAQMDTSLPVVAYGRLNPAFVFAYQRAIPKFNNPDSLYAYLRQQPAAYVISSKKYDEKLLRINSLQKIVHHPDLFERPVTTVWHYVSSSEKVP
ncbi:MAG: ArnT family glycosyltransferase [Bernardetiaceae bacterium]